MINYGYFRHRFDAHADPKLNQLVDDIGIEGYAYYYTLIEIYGAKINTQEDKNEAKIHLRTIANTWRKRTDSCVRVLTKLQLSGLLMVTITNSTCILSIPNFLKYYGSYSKKKEERTLKKRKEKKIKEKKKDTPKNNEFILKISDAYSLYPRKEGKKKGIEILTKKINSQDDYDKLIISIKNYSALLKANNTEKKYTKQFSAFANMWEDYLPENGFEEIPTQDSFEKELEDFFISNGAKPQRQD